MRANQQANRVHALLAEASRCLASDQTTKAKKLCEKAVAQAPQSADAHMVLADVLAARAELEAARKHYDKATKCEQYHFGAWLNYGMFLKENREIGNAVKAFKNAVMIDPKSSLARYNLARTLMIARVYRDAAEHFGVFVKMEPDYAEGHYLLGLTYEALGDLNDAMRCFEAALEVDPDYVRAIYGKGTVSQALGDFEDAERYFKRAIELEPRYGKSYAALAASKLYDDENADQILADIQVELDDPELHPTTRIGLLNAAYRILDRKGKYDEAFEYLSEFNAMVDRGRSDEYDQQVELWDRIRTVYDKEYFDNRTIFGSQTQQPIFIVGMPRSGTTLTEQIIASHPDVLGAGELDGLARCIFDFAEENAIAWKTYPRFLTELSEAQLSRVASRYIDSYPGDASQYLRVTDKLPDNYIHLGSIHTLFPNAKIIWCRRNPIDTCLSCYVQTFSNLLWYCFDQKNVARRYREHVDFVNYWKSVLPNQIFEVNYEALTQDPEHNIRQLIEFCELEWDDACLQFHETDRAVSTASLWQVRQPMYKSSVGKWKNYEKHLGPMIEELGDLVKL